jgi:gamma-glutamylputrescine oxidase
MADSSLPQGYYAASAQPGPSRPALRNRRHADVCVIGAGFTGLNAALHLAEQGASVVVLEAHGVGFAASGRNGGQIHTGYRKSQAELEAWLGAGHARDLWTLCEEAKAQVRSLAGGARMAAELKDGLIIAAHNRRAAGALADDAEALARAYNYPRNRMLTADDTAAAIGTDSYAGGMLDSGGGHLHPLRFANGLAECAERAGAVIHENSRALALERNDGGVVVSTADGAVTAGHAIVALDAFSGELLPELAPYIGHVESFVTATAPLSPELARSILPADPAVADTRHVLDYYRKSADGRLLFAGREAYWGEPADIAALVRPRMLRLFPSLHDTPTEYAWSGTVGITRTRMPHLGRLGARVFFAHGYSGQGVALSCLSGRLMAEAALGRAERFDVLARVPAQPFPGGPWLRKPLIAAALLAFKIADQF